MNAIHKIDYTKIHKIKLKTTELINFISTFQPKLYANANRAGVMPIRYYLNKDSHFTERFMDRNLNQGYIGSLFKQLLERKYCEILFLAKLNSRFDLAVTYKDIKVLFIVKVLDNGITINPVTAMPLSYKTSSKYEINL